MIRYSFIVMQRLSAFPSPEAFRKALATLRDCGYDGVELNLTEPLGLDIDAVEKGVREFGLRIPSFLTGEAYFDGLCLSSPDADVRRATVARLIQYLDTAERFGSILVVGLLQGLRRDEPDLEVANVRIRDGLRRLADAAEARSIGVVPSVTAYFSKLPIFLQEKRQFSFPPFPTFIKEIFHRQNY